MTKTNSSNQVFIAKLTEIILSNLEKENFGVNDLALAAGMTSFSLRRKLNTFSKKSINQLIREVRLQKAMEILQKEEFTASEVAYKVGFGSPAYFTKCFHEYFGYPPGEAKSRNPLDIEENKDIIENNNTDQAETHLHKKHKQKIIFYIAGVFFALFVIYLFLNNLSFESFSILPGNRLKTEDKSIAVLPFKSLSSDEENQYFSEGVTRNILYNLIQISEIKVINSPIEQTDENTLNLRKIAGKLNVRFLIGGSVQKSGEQVLVMAQLTDISKNQIIWSERYTRKLSDIFMIQSDIAKQVASELQAVITVKEKNRIEKVPTQNIEAYNLYLMGRFLWNRRTGEGIKKSIEYFNRAIDLDPNYALAYTGLADVYNMLPNFGLYKPKKEGYEKAYAYALKAVELDNNLAEAHTSLGFILLYIKWEWEEAEKELKLALELNPNYAFAHQIYAQCLDITGDHVMARQEIDIALKLDPLTPIIHSINASLYYNEGNFNASLKEYQEALTIEKNYRQAHWQRFLIYCRLGDGERALKELQLRLMLDTLNLKYVDIVGQVYTKSGLAGTINIAREILPDDNARLYAISGHKEEALTCLENYLNDSPGDGLVRLINKIDYESLRAEPRFKAVIDKLGLTEYYLKRIKQPGYIKN